MRGIGLNRSLMGPPIAYVGRRHVLWSLSSNQALAFSPLLCTTTMHHHFFLFSFLSACSSCKNHKINGSLGMTYVNLNGLPMLTGKDSWFELEHREHPRGKVQMKLLVDLKRVGKQVAFVLIVALPSLYSIIFIFLVL